MYRMLVEMWMMDDKVHSDEVSDGSEKHVKWTENKIVEKKRNQNLKIWTILSLFILQK